MGLLFNVAKGRFARYADLPVSNDALTWILLKTAQTESNLQDYATLAALLAAGGGALNVEATFTGYSRLNHTTAVVTPDNTANTNAVDDTTDPTWNPTTSQALVEIVCCYNPDTTQTPPTNDANLIPVFMDAFAITTPTSGAITYQVPVGGFATAA